MDSLSQGAECAKTNLFSGEWEWENHHDSAEPYNLQMRQWYYGAEVHPRVLLKTLKGWGPEPAVANLIVAAPKLYREMLRYLPLLERAESDPELWLRLTMGSGTGITTLNGYRAALKLADEGSVQP